MQTTAHTDTDADRPLRQALTRRDLTATIAALEPTLHGVVAKMHAPILGRDELLQAARIGAHAALLSFDGDRRNLRHVVGWVVLVARRHVLTEIRDAQAAGRREQWEGMREVTHRHDEDGTFNLVDRLTGGQDPAQVVVDRDELATAVHDERARRERDAAEVRHELPEHQARAFALVHVDCLSYAEAAIRLGVSVKTVRVYVWRGRRVLDSTLPQPEHLRRGWEAA